MLLKEIFANRQLTNQGTYEYTPDFEKSKLVPAGAKIVEVNPHYEELEMFRKLGLDPNNPQHFPVVYAYTLTKKSEKPEEQEHITGLMDALKKRNPQHTMSDENLNAVYTNALKRIMKMSIPTHLCGDAKQGFTQLKNILNHATVSKSAIIVPLASSSPVVQMMAKAVSEVTKAPVVNMFSKEAWPEQSSHSFTKSRGYEPRVNWINPKQRKLKLERELAELENADFSTESELNKIEHRIDQIKDQLKHQFQLKNYGRGQVDAERGFYGFQKIDPNIASKFQNKIIILIDDNVVTNVTMIDAVKAFYRIGIVPKQIFGLVTHMYK